MANKDFPRGLWPLYHAGGGRVRSNEYVVTASQTIYQGDPVIVTSAGTISLASDDSGVLCIGVAASRTTSATEGGTAGGVISVYDDPMTVFGIQSVSGVTTLATHIFNSANPDVTAPSTGDISATELLTASAQTATFKVLRLIPDVDNALGEHSNWEVMFDEHFLKYSSTGV